MSDHAFTYVYFAGLIVGSGIRLVYTRPYKRRQAVYRRRSAVEIALMVAAGVAMLVLPLAYLLSDWPGWADYPLPAWARLAAGLTGTGFFLAALWLLWRSHVDLGRQWSPHVEIRRDHTLITTGVYRRIRHPMYAAHLLWGIAQGLLLHNAVAGWCMLAAFVPMYFVRVGPEERAMLERFGRTYRDYMDRTGRMLPRLRPRGPQPSDNHV